MDCSEQKTVKMYRTVFLLLSSVLIAACESKQTAVITVPYYNEPDFTPIFLSSKDEAKSKVPHVIADFSFLDQDSNMITQNDIEGKIHVANFIFTSCGSICPSMISNMKILSNELKGYTDIVLLSYSVTPWIDKPSVLKRYKERNEIRDANWHFLTGNKQDIYSLARRSYFADEEIGFTKDSTEFLHTEHFILVDKTRRIRGIYNGTLQLEMQNLLEDIEALAKEEE